MKNIYSIIACCAISLVLIGYRFAYIDTRSAEPLKVTSWDALGYYMYLPGMCLYKDVTELKWFPDVDKQYSLSGGWFYQASKEDNGKYVFKYLAGVAIMESPFYYVADVYAKHSKYKRDGFSPPYQFAVAFGAIIWCILAVFLLRRILLWYFSDGVTAISLLLLCLGTNLIQYVSVNGSLSHAYIFPLYAAVIYTTIQWHRNPKGVWAALTGYIIGLATICRPTEAVMLFIPLLWDTHTKEAAKAKWQKVKEHKGQAVVTIIFGLLAVLPQLIYWKTVTGSLTYDSGSKWDFLLPHFKVLFGWEKGWFIYTPVTLLFILGLFFVKKLPFKNAVIWFCGLNIYIIIAWHEWRYAASYSARALVESYPVFALPLAAFVQKATGSKGRVLFYALSIYLIGVNLFQTVQYNNTILHYDDMNRAYYGAIYLNAHPSPLDMSLLDSNELISNEAAYTSEPLIKINTPLPVRSAANTNIPVAETGIIKAKKDEWLKIECTANIKNGLWAGYLNADVQDQKEIKHNRVRLFSPISKEGKDNDYVFYMHLPPHFSTGKLKLYISAGSDIDGSIEKLSVTALAH